MKTPLVFAFYEEKAGDDDQVPAHNQHDNHPRWKFKDGMPGGVDHGRDGYK